jgi:hypothetical protein
MPKLDRYQEEQETVTFDRCHWLLDRCPVAGPGDYGWTGCPSGLARLDQLRRTSRSFLHLDRSF